MDRAIGATVATTERTAERPCQRCARWEPCGVHPETARAVDEYLVALARAVDPSTVPALRVPLTSWRVERHDGGCPACRPGRPCGEHAARAEDDVLVARGAASAAALRAEERGPRPEAPGRTGLGGSVPTALVVEDERRGHGRAVAPTRRYQATGPGKVLAHGERDTAPTATVAQAMLDAPDADDSPAGESVRATVQRILDIYADDVRRAEARRTVRLPAEVPSPSARFRARLEALALDWAHASSIAMARYTPTAHGATALAREVKAERQALARMERERTAPRPTKAERARAAQAGRWAARLASK